MRNLRPFTSALAVLAGVAVATGCIDDSGPDASLRVINRSDYWITEIRVTPIDEVDWGPNLLDGDGLAPGESLVVRVHCDFYDALLVDEDGVECRVYDLDLCLNDATWVIRNETCSVFGAAKAAREAAAKEANPASAANVAAPM